LSSLSISVLCPRNSVVIKAAHSSVCEAVCKRVGVNFQDMTHTYSPPEPVHIFGWSRGAIAALTLAKRLNDEGCKCEKTGWKRKRECVLRIKPDGTIEEVIYRSSERATAVAHIKPVPVHFLGLIDPVDTGGGQMIGTNSTIVPSNVKTAWVAEATQSTTVGGIVFGSDIPTVEDASATTFTHKKYAVTHESSGFDTTIGADLEAAAKAAGVPF